MTYSFFMLPSMGLGLEASGYQNILGPMYPILGGENGVFLAAWAWKFSLFVFMVFRTALPIVMAKTDKALLSKINVIIRYLSFISIITFLSGLFRFSFFALISGFFHNESYFWNTEI